MRQGTVDELPRGIDWHCKEICQQGDIIGLDGKPLEETLEVWFRDPVDCIRELIGNPTFRDHLIYAPQKLYTDNSHTTRRIDEMWTADWWWRTQVSEI